MIVGPGNVYVALAKREVAGHVGVPAAFAGPSEVVVVADGSVPAEWVAVDVVVQAEHGPGGLAWLVTWDRAVADAVDAEVGRLVGAWRPAGPTSRPRCDGGGYVVLVDGPEQAVAVANLIAPEHLQLMVADPAALVAGRAPRRRRVLGPVRPGQLGDYVAGPSHVLPTVGTARFPAP